MWMVCSVVFVRIPGIVVIFGTFWPLNLLKVQKLTVLEVNVGGSTFGGGGELLVDTTTLNNNNITITVKIKMFVF